MPGLRLHVLTTIGFLAPFAAMGCNSIIGLNDLTSQTDDGAAKLSGAGGSSGSGGGAGTDTADAEAEGAVKPDCTTNQECTTRATSGAHGDGSIVPAVCLSGQCVALLSDDCTQVTGDYANDKAILIGSLFATTGSTATQNVPRQQSATLAVEEINSAGGIPSPSAGESRPLVMVSCNTVTNVLRAAGHLANDLHVPAIVGPNTSQDTLDVSNKVTIQAGTAVLSPSAVAASIGGLVDNDLTWLMVPSDAQRAALMRQHISWLEEQINSSRDQSTVKLAIAFRNDALGTGTRDGLSALTLNDHSLTDPVNAGSTTGNVRIDSYDGKVADQSALVAKEVAFGPDIIVLAGTAETVTSLMDPIEKGWNDTQFPNRPYYLMIDPSKGPELLTEVKGNESLRKRVRGTGITPSLASSAVNQAFSVDYLSRYGSTPSASGTGPSYDATYAIAYALAATKDSTVSGAKVVQGLRKLAGGSTSINTGSQNLLTAFQKLTQGDNITAIGTFLPLEWDSTGTVVGGTIEMWCIESPGDVPTYQSSGLLLDVKTGMTSGKYTDNCE